MTQKTIFSWAVSHANSVKDYCGYSSLGSPKIKIVVDCHSRLTSSQGKGEMFTWWLIKAEESSCEKTTFTDEYSTNKLMGNQNGTSKLTGIQNKAVHMDTETGIQNKAVHMDTETGIQNKAVHMDTATEQCSLNSGNNKEPSDLENLLQ